MDVHALIDLRKQVEDTLVSQRSTLEKQLAALGGSIASLGGGKVARGGRGSTLKGKKVAPKYRSPEGESWAGRGAKPRWLVAAIKEGKKLEQFLIEKATPKARKNVGRSVSRVRRIQGYQDLRFKLMAERNSWRVSGCVLNVPNKQLVTIVTPGLCTPLVVMH